jgi:arylsulfatase A-like enzyme
MFDEAACTTNSEIVAPISTLRMNRRDFLKWATLLPVMPLLDRVCEANPFHGQGDTPNIIIILFDTLSARHLSLYGYQRETTPNLAKFAEQATVYHSHYAAGNFTTPGTASLLTGTYPWTHRAFHHAGKMTNLDNLGNLFEFLGDDYNKIAYPHNMWAHLLLNQIREDIDVYLAPTTFSLFNDMFYSSRDLGISFRSIEELIFQNKGFPASLFLSLIGDAKNLAVRANWKEYRDLYPRGIPRFGGISYDVFFLVRKVVEGALGVVNSASQPFIAYLHFFPPHGPYRPRREFVGAFNDAWNPIAKEQHCLSEGHPEEYLNQQRIWYDEYVAHIDAEFGRIYESLKKNELTQNSYIILTSDHGELFERGVHGHVTPLLYEPVIRVPLLISKPGQQNRRDVDIPTSCVDLLPTLIHHITDQPIPDWCEGDLLPDLGGTRDNNRSVFSVEAKENPAYAPLHRGTFAMIQGKYKLIHYSGYPGYEDEYELYDLEDDPEELHNLYSPKNSIAINMREYLKAKLLKTNRPYS